MQPAKYLTQYNVIIDEEEKEFLELAQEHAERENVYWDDSHEAILLASLRTQKNEYSWKFKIIYFVIAFVILVFLIMLYRMKQ